MTAKRMGAVGLAVLVLAICFFAFRRFGQHASSDRDSLLALLPADASAVLYADVAELRSAPFFSALSAWAPQPAADADYAQFVAGTGFDYERDLDRLAIAVRKRGLQSILLAVADGHFDRKKISAYAAKFGSVAKQKGQDIFLVPMSGGSRRLSFIFISDRRIALTDDDDAAVLWQSPTRDAASADWRTHFLRLAGSPVFAVLRQDAGAGQALASQAPGGLRSPQLSTLLDSLDWITLAAKPQETGLRFVAEGESSSETTVKQLSDMLAGIVQLAQAGLNDQKTRQQLAAATREADLELLRSAEISKLDRGSSKAVRVMFDVSPKFLAAALPAGNAARRQRQTAAPRP